MVLIQIVLKGSKRSSLKLQDCDRTNGLPINLDRDGVLPVSRLRDE
jgi:hypothetical protein